MVRRMLNGEQRERYLRHILLREVGAQGQQKLLASSVLIVGAGGLGAPVIQYLAAAGVGRLVVMDPDIVARSNLQRQTIYRTADIGAAKVDVARNFAHALNPDVNFVSVNHAIDAANAAEAIASCDLVIEGVDNFATRYVINRGALEARRTLVSTAVGRFDGQVAVFGGHDGQSPCYRCFAPQAPLDADAICETEGVMGPVTGVVGALAAMEALKLLLGIPGTLLGRIMIYEALNAKARAAAISRDPECVDCSRFG